MAAVPSLLRNVISRARTAAAIVGGTAEDRRLLGFEV